jgi:hypothetical protein
LKNHVAPAWGAVELRVPPDRCPATPGDVIEAFEIEEVARAL